MAKFFPRRQLEIRGGVDGSEPIYEAQRAMAEIAGAKAGERRQTLELECRCRAIAALELAAAALSGARREFAATAHCGIALRAQAQRAGTVEMADGVAGIQLIPDDRDDRAGRGQHVRTCD